MLGYKNIVCALNFDEHQNAVLKLGAALTRESDATLHLLHIARIPFPDMDVPLPIGAKPRWEDESRARLEAMVKRAGAQDLKYSIEIKSGVPDLDIVQIAARLGADLIVIATHGRTGFQHLALGSVAEQVIRHAECPVLVIRPRPPAPPE
jgi:nucleotide-binding universal stress UspA family protein